MSAFICGDGSGDAAALATQTATAFARSVADASVYGDGIHGATCYENSGSVAGSTAKLWLEVYAEALASSSECRLCDDWPDSWDPVRREIFLRAVGNAAPTVSTRIWILLEIEFKTAQLTAW